MTEISKDVWAERSVDIGRYTIRQHKIKTGGISIYCNRDSDSNGEGGTFSEAELEEIIGDYYAKHF